MEEEPVPAPDRSRRRILIEVALALTALWLPSIVSATSHFIDPSGRMHEISTLDHLYSVLHQLGNVIFLAFLIKRISGGFHRVLLEKPRPMRTFQGFLVLGATFVVLYLVSYAAKPWAGLDKFLVSSPSHGSSLALTFAYMFVGVSYEELFFRGYLAARLEELGMHPIVLALVTSALFATTHIYQGWFGPIHAFAYGMLMSGSRALFKSLWPGLLAHWLYDIFAISRVR